MREGGAQNPKFPKHLVSIQLRAIKPATGTRLAAATSQIFGVMPPAGSYIQTSRAHSRTGGRNNHGLLNWRGWRPRQEQKGTAWPPDRRHNPHLMLSSPGYREPGRHRKSARCSQPRNTPPASRLPPEERGTEEGGRLSRHPAPTKMRPRHLRRRWQVRRQPVLIR